MTILKIFTLITIVTSIESHKTNEMVKNHTKAPVHYILHPHRQHTTRPGHSTNAESETVIENKNVNIVVNVDPKDVAEELWKIIEYRNPSLRRSPGSKKVMKQLEQAVKPIVTPTRRSSASAHEIADNLDYITRRALKNAGDGKTALEREIMTRDIVARMMNKLKNVHETIDNNDNTADDNVKVQRRMLNNKTNFDSEIDDDDDDDDNEGFVDLLITISKRKLRDAME